MSTILDSLKKSSEQRENGNTSIDKFSFGSSHKSSHSGLIVSLVIITLTAVILYFGYHYIYSGEKQGIVAETMPETTVAMDQRSTEIKSLGTEKNNKQLASSSPQKIDKPSSESVKERIKQIKEEKDKRNAESLAELNKPEQNAKADKLAAKISELKQKDNEKKVEISRDITPSSQLQKIEPVIQPLKEVPSQKYLYVYQLPFSVRKDIPKIKLNIHVYDEQAENRIAIINGVRFAIGDLIDNVVLVKDILQEGVLLEFNEHEYLVPK